MKEEILKILKNNTVEVTNDCSTEAILEIDFDEIAEEIANHFKNLGERSEPPHTLLSDVAPYILTENVLKGLISEIADEVTKSITIHGEFTIKHKELIFENMKKKLW